MSELILEVVLGTVLLLVLLSIFIFTSSIMLFVLYIIWNWLSVFYVWGLPYIEVLLP